MPADSAGFRGALLLKKGRYVVTDTLHLRADGVVIRGEGAGFGGTWILHRRPKVIKDPTPGLFVHITQPDKAIIPTFESHGGQMDTQKIADVTQGLVPAGFERMAVSDTSRIKVGDQVVVVIGHTQKWIDDLGVGGVWKLPFELQIPRIVKAVDADRRTITFTVGITSRIDIQGGYATAEIHTITSDRRIKNIGMEDILFISDYDRTRKDNKGYYNDENHANYAFRFYSARDGWMRRCVGFFYSGGLVATGGSQHLTVQDCAMIDGVSQDTPANHKGSRKYYFNANGEHMLFQRCYGRFARHAFVGNGAKGSTVFLDSLSEYDHLKNEWHQRWGHGHLFDNISCDAQIGIAGIKGHGHGQKSAFAVAWNNLILNKRTWEPDLFVNKQKGLVQNYAIGNIIRGSGKIGADSLGETGHIEARNRFVQPRSLYLAQLRDRLGDAALLAITSPLQRSDQRGAVWMDLIAKYSHFPHWLDPDKAPWPGYEEWLVIYESQQVSENP